MVPRAPHTVCWFNCCGESCAFRSTTNRLQFHPSLSLRFTRFGTAVCGRENGVFCRAISRSPRAGRIVLVSKFANDNSVTSDGAQKYDYDDIEALILSPPSEPKRKALTSRALTLLELEALAVEGSANVSIRERTEVMNAILDLLEQKGVPPGDAFEFVIHSQPLIKDLIVEANEHFGEKSKGQFSPAHDNLESEKEEERDSEPNQCVNLSNAQTSADKREVVNPDGQNESTIEKISDLGRSSEGTKSVESLHCKELKPMGKASAAPREDASKVQTDSSADMSLASRVAICALQRGLPGIVYYFLHLNMRAFDISKALRYVGGRIDDVMAKVEFLRSIGLTASQLSAILAKAPELLSHECNSHVLVAEYLQCLGLTRKEIGMLVVKFPQILYRYAQAELRHSVDRLKELGTSGRQVKKLIVRHPILLTGDAEEKLKPLVSYLESIGVKRNHIGPLLIRRPVILDSNVEKDLRPIGEYLKSIHASADDIDKIITSFPLLFRYDLQQDFQPTVVQLESFGVDPLLMGKLFRRYPQLLKNRFNFGLKINFLLNLGLEKKDLGKVVYNAPQLFGLSIKNKLLPAIEYLGSLGIQGSSLIKVLKHRPMILAYSIESKLKLNVKFFEELGIKHDDIGRLVTRHPQLLSLSVEKNLEPTVKYLIDMGFTRKEIADMVKKLPSLLGFSVETVLDPKYKYLIDVMRRAPKELVQFPQFFSYSLTQRIIPRNQLLGKSCQWHSLNSIYSCSNLAFEK
eukprot:c28403_g1_i4 orf=3-2240(-)